MIGRRSKSPTQEPGKPKGFDDFELRLGDLMRGERATLGKSLLDVQRELKIKATYIAAIENADVSAFETQGFVAGYVRSYARYLGMDPDTSFARFCQEANFEVAHGMSAAASTASMTGARREKAENRDPFVHASFIPRAESVFSRVQPGAVGSVAVLVALIGALGYGGWSVLQEVQRVTISPVAESPVVYADIDPLGNVKGEAPLVRSAPAEKAAAEGTDLLNRDEARDLPLMTARDGPIAGIRPNLGDSTSDSTAGTIDDVVAGVVAGEDDIQVMEEGEPGVEVLAVRPSWVRVSAADGTVLFEKILDAGERYSVPALPQAPLLRSGNSGSVYFTVGGKTYGPAAPGAQVVKNLSLAADDLTAAYTLADLTGDADLAAIVNVADATPAPAP